MPSIPATWEADRQIFDLEASLVYRATSRIAMAAQRNAV